MASQKPLTKSMPSSALARRDVSKARGVPKDSTEAVTWYRRAADQGDAGAQSMLGTEYANRRWRAQDTAEAVVVPQSR